MTLTPEEIIEHKKINSAKFREIHREEIRTKQNNRYREDLSYRMGVKNYYLKNKERISIRGLKQRRLDGEREKKSEYDKVYYMDLKNKMFEILGKECIICGECNEKFLTIDHINGGGRNIREEYHGKIGELRNLKNCGWPIEEIKSNYQILCFNHNCSRNREYLGEGFLNTDTRLKRNKRLWEEAFKFFGPCSCGQKDLRFLTIDHKNDGGTIKRMMGNSFGIELIRSFRKQNWPDSIKQDFQFLCYNCNCSKHLRC